LVSLWVSFFLFLFSPGCAFVYFGVSYIDPFVLPDFDVFDLVSSVTIQEIGWKEHPEITYFCRVGG